MQLICVIVVADHPPRENTRATPCVKLLLLDICVNEVVRVVPDTTSGVVDVAVPLPNPTFTVPPPDEVHPILE